MEPDFDGLLNDAAARMRSWIECAVDLDLPDDVMAQGLAILTRNTGEIVKTEMENWQPVALPN